MPRASDPVIGVLSANLGARLCHQPRFSLRSGNCFNRPQVNQHLARGNIQGGKKNRKMSRAFSNNDNSVIITNSFNINVPYDESKILAWLSPLEPWVRHRDIGAQRVDDIGAWLLETQEFRRWHDGSMEGGSNHVTLFCHGNPGVGKSYIM